MSSTAESDFIARQVAALLEVPSDETRIADYYIKFTRKSGLSVNPHIGHGRGKGLQATASFKEGEVVLIEPPLVACQEPDSAAIVAACQHSFAVLGPTLEAHLAHAARALRADPALCAATTCQSDESDDCEEGSPPCCPTFPVSEEVESGLRSGAIRLPGSDQWPLPSPVLGRGDASLLFASEVAETEAWAGYAQLLCANPPASGGRRVPQADAQRQRRAALRQLRSFARECNPVFEFVARALAGVLSRADAELEAGGLQPEGERTDAEWAALVKAWEPLAHGHKRLWWELPVTGLGEGEAAELRQQRHELCQTAADLLRRALWDPRFPALFHEDVVGCLVGMVELNNLDLVVPSPALAWYRWYQEQYLTDPRRSEGQQDPAGAAAREVAVFVEAYGDALSVSGTGFYRLQSCCNHSCRPNTHAFKRDQDTTGAAVLVALRDISLGEEITISYIDEDAPLQERQDALAEYEFLCTCEKCVAEGVALVDQSLTL
ncbi:hypothetical protein ACKKBG_A35940 [Auxenochlorella protothecoides x Auxenochlorella symbiontica]